MRRFLKDTVNRLFVVGMLICFSTAILKDANGWLLFLGSIVVSMLIEIIYTVAEVV